MARNPRTLKRPQAKPEADAPPVFRDLSAAKLGKIKHATELRIDAFMKSVGYANPAERTDEEGWRWFDFGSAKGRAGIVESDADGEMFLRAESLVMELPTEKDALLPLMRELLEANMTLAGSARLGISGEGVFVCATIPIVELGSGDVAAHIHSVMAIADSFGQPPAQETEHQETEQETGSQETLHQEAEPQETEHRENELQETGQEGARQEPTPPEQAEQS